MANFLEQLAEKAKSKESTLKNTLHVGQRQLSLELIQLVRDHWHPLPDRLDGDKRPGFAVDGSSRRADLVNGSVLFVAQSLIIGEGLNDLRADIEILPGTVKAEKMDRFADLMRQSLEISLAAEFAERIPEGSILYLDGALYGTLPQLYPLEGEGIPENRDYAHILLQDYRKLFRLCQDRNLLLISIAKTNRQALFSRVLQQRALTADADLQGDVREISDSALFDELTEHRAGYATPLILGTYSFHEGSTAVVLQRLDARTFPAILSFFVRFSDYDDALRVDVPACCVGRSDRLGELDHDLLPPAVVQPVVQVLMGDYGGLQVYNALAYVSDHEVRLTRHKMYDIYLPMIASVIGEEIRIDRSQRRFVE